MTLLLVNPNTTARMTATIAEAARAAAAPGTTITAVTSDSGPASIEGYYDEAFAVPGLIAALIAGEKAGATAGIIACFDDTGLDAARAAVTMPVLGLCESALMTAAPLAKRISVVTTLPRSVVPLEELVDRYGMTRRVRVRACDVAVLALEQPAGLARLCAEIEHALEQDHAEAIVLGCAGMATLAATLSQRYGIPVIDGVGAAVKQAEGLIALGHHTSKRGTYAPPLAKAYSGLMRDFAPLG